MRFLTRDGRVTYGEALLPPGVTDIAEAKQARVINGSPWGGYSITDKIAQIRLLLCPLAREDIRTVRCLGLNYEQHAREVRSSEMPCCIAVPGLARAGLRS